MLEAHVVGLEAEGLRNSSQTSGATKALSLPSISSNLSASWLLTLNPSPGLASRVSASSLSRISSTLRSCSGVKSKPPPLLAASIFLKITSDSFSLVLKALRILAAEDLGLSATSSPSWHPLAPSTSSASESAPSLSSSAPKSWPSDSNPSTSRSSGNP
eukprot:CAMPEP_0184302606 /NCGR_PEP_ID=MMETSP1049-20130417/12515_1 /TAXON_ID=77928 /ORGANISM="Proteomonas sulcata, Strain CCMP704" /LENGTH=158 /DNA_ID=CAMNT_0026613927 /DNA_START=400 /DNA_END=876 /DNA_ORIENTATION=-